MKKSILLIAGILSLSFATAAFADMGEVSSPKTGPLASKASAGYTILEVALFEPIQWPAKEKDVKGLGLDLIYGAKNNMYGVNLGLVSKINGDLKGVTWGFVSLVDGDAVGYQDSFWSVVKGDFVGMQGGLYATATNFVGWQGGFYAHAVNLSGLQTGMISIVDDTAKGVQIGLYNYAKKVKGIQLGLINVADNLCGLQLGVVNVNKKGDPLKVFPIFNFSTKW